MTTSPLTLRQRFVLEWLQERYPDESYWLPQNVRDNAAILGETAPEDVVDTMKDECGYSHEAYEDDRAALALALTQFDYDARMSALEALSDR